MITQSEAVAIGTAICGAATRSTQENEGEVRSSARWAARGACIFAMDNIWYNVLPLKVRENFSYDREAFYKACGWPN